MKTTVLTAALTLILAGSALAQTPTNLPSAPTGQEVAQQSGDPSVTAWKTSIKLDDGKKWKVNSATKVGMQDMLAAVTKASEQKPTPDGKTLQAELKTSLKKVFQNCDMTGPTHDNLHIYLLSLIEKVDALSEQDSPQAVKDSVVRVKAQLLEFGNYFE